MSVDHTELGKTKKSEYKLNQLYLMLSKMVYNEMFRFDKRRSVLMFKDGNMIKVYISNLNITITECIV